MERKFKRNNSNQTYSCLKMIVVVILGGGHTSDKKRDLLVTPADLPIQLQASPGTIGMLENLHRPACVYPSHKPLLSGKGLIRIAPVVLPLGSYLVPKYSDPCNGKCIKEQFMA